MRGMGDAVTSAGWLASTLPSFEASRDYCSQGRLNWLTSASCWAYPLAQWQTWQASTYTAAPPAPSNLRIVPADGADALATVQGLTNEQIRRQQELNAAGVDPVSDYGWGVLPDLPGLPDMNWWLWLGLGAVGLFAVTTMTAGGPRRYGR